MQQNMDIIVDINKKNDDAEMTSPKMTGPYEIHSGFFKKALSLEQALDVVR